MHHCGLWKPLFFSEDSQTKSVAVIGKFKIKLTLGQDALYEEPE